MKVEWKKLMFGLAIGAGMMMMASCSDEENFDPGGSTGKETPEPTEKAFLSMRLSTGSLAGTRVAVDPTTSGRTEEQVVNHVRMVLYETKNNTVRYSWDLNVSTDGMNEFTGGDVVRGEDVPSATPTVSRFVTVGREVVKQDYELLILINPPGELLEITEQGNPRSYLSRAANMTKESLIQPYGIAADKNFYMTNHQDLIFVPEVELRDNQRMAEENPVRVEVERAVAKVVVSGVPEVVPHGDRIDNLKWGLDVTNMYTYWMRKMTFIANSGGVPNEMEQLNAGYREERYAEDPNFTRFSSWNGGNPVGQFEYLSGTPELSKNFDDYDYTLENTMDAADQRHDVTTRVVISGTYTPNGFGSVATRNGGGISFYYFKGNAIRVEAMRDMVNDRGQIPQELRDAGLEQAIENVLAWNPNAFNSPTASFSEGGIHFYYQGVCYYTVLIRHFSNNMVPVLMGYGRYGVVRNNVYQLSINKIIGPGQPVINPPGTDPDDEDTSWISADVNIMRWYIRNQNVEELL